MKSNTDVNGLVSKSDGQTGSGRISRTDWGYIVDGGRKARRRAAWGEVAAISTCMMFGAFAYAPWLMAPTLPAFGAYLGYEARLAATIMFFVFAMQTYRISRLGLASELQIDTLRRTLRLARRNRGGRVHFTRKLDFSQIESVFMKRSGEPGSMGRLFIQPRGESGPIQVAKGPAKELEEVLSTMIAEMRRARATAPVKPLRAAGGKDVKASAGLFGKSRLTRSRLAGAGR